MPIKESGEMYLETILLLSKQKSLLRSVDIVEEMGFSKPSVSRAVSKLKELRYITVDNKGNIALTESGKQLAETIYERHKLLTVYFKYIGVSDEVAEADACRIEHILSDETFEAIKRHCRNSKIES